VESNAIRHSKIDAGSGVARVAPEMVTRIAFFRRCTHLKATHFSGSLFFGPKLRGVGGWVNVGNARLPEVSEWLPRGIGREPAYRFDWSSEDELCTRWITRCKAARLDRDGVTAEQASRVNCLHAPAPTRGRSVSTLLCGWPW
jgi:hypothetical protein